MEEVTVLLLVLCMESFWDILIGDPFLLVAAGMFILGVFAANRLKSGSLGQVVRGLKPAVVMSNGGRKQVQAADEGDESQEELVSEVSLGECGMVHPMGSHGDHEASSKSQTGTSSQTIHGRFGRVSGMFYQNKELQDKLNVLYAARRISNEIDSKNALRMTSFVEPNSVSNEDSQSAFAFSNPQVPVALASQMSMGTSEPVSDQSSQCSFGFSEPQAPSMLKTAANFHSSDAEIIRQPHHSSVSSNNFGSSSQPVESNNLKRNSCLDSYPNSSFPGSSKTLSSFDEQIQAYKAQFQKDLYGNSASQSFISEELPNMTGDVPMSYKFGLKGDNSITPEPTINTNALIHQINNQRDRNGTMPFHRPLRRSSSECNLKGRSYNDGNQAAIPVPRQQTVDMLNDEPLMTSGTQGVYPTMIGHREVSNSQMYFNHSLHCEPSFQRSESLLPTGREKEAERINDLHLDELETTSPAHVHQEPHANHRSSTAMNTKESFHPNLSFLPESAYEDSQESEDSPEEPQFLKNLRESRHPSLTHVLESSATSSSPKKRRNAKQIAANSSTLVPPLRRSTRAITINRNPDFHYY